MGIRWQYCIDGDGYGFPAAIIHPDDEDAYLFINLEPETNEGMVVDFDNLSVNILIWGFVVTTVHFCRNRFLQKRQTPKLTG